MRSSATASLTVPCSDIFVSFQQRTFDKSAYNVKNILDSVKIQLSVPIYFFSVISHTFLLSNYRVCIIEFCVLLHFNQIGRIILKSVASHSYAELKAMM